MEFLKPFSRVLSLARSEKYLLLTFIAAAAGIASALIIEPILFGRVIDELGKDAGFLHYLALWGGLGVANATLSIYLAIAADRFAHRQRLRAMESGFERSISLPHRFHSQNGSGKVVRTILTGSDQVFNMSLSLFRENLIAMWSVLILIPMAFYLQPKLACALLALACVSAASNWLIIRRSHKRQVKVELKHQDLASRLLDVIGNVSVIRSFTRVALETKLFRDMTSDVLKAQYPVLTWWGLLNVVTRLSSMTAMVTIVGIGSYLVHRGEASQGQVVTFVGFSTLLIGRLDQISSFFNRIVSQAPTLNLLFDLIDQVNPDARPGGRSFAPSVSGRVTFENVTFQYRAKGQGVFNLNFEIEAGQTVALVGPSGSGKTTSLALLQRIYSPNIGRILIDGQDIQDLDVESLCGSIATVFQEPGLFNRSIYDNILVGRPSATREEVEEAAKRADAHEFILARPGGYDFVVGERGLALSGGERQRIAIARAILKNAPILVLDEATSALDNETEKKVQFAMDQLRDGKTTFVIAHRLSTIVSADHILVFSGGRIVQSGTFTELQRVSGLFARLLQAGQLGEEGHPHASENESKTETQASVGL